MKPVFKAIYPGAEYVKLPIADGGEGTVAALVDATDGELVTLTVTGPLATPVDSFYGRSGDGTTAVIEMAAASGLDLVPAAQRNPLLTTSYGTGELIVHALDRGVPQFYHRDRWQRHQRWRCRHAAGLRGQTA